MPGDDAAIHGLTCYPILIAEREANVSKVGD
jgi:hypothetical protein